MPTRKHPKSPYIHITGRRPDGTQVNVSTKTENKTAASMMADHVKLLLASKEPGPLEMMEALEIAEVICKSANRSRRTPIPAISYLQGLLEEHTGSEHYLRVKRLVIEILEHVLLENNRATINLFDVTADDIGKFQAHLVRLGRVAGTRRSYMHALSSLFETAVKRAITTENVVKQVNKPPRANNSPRRPFTDDELKKVFAEADHEWRGMILVALYTGLRLGDVSRLVYRDIDLNTRHIRAAVRKTGGFEPKPIPKVLMQYFLTLSWPSNLDTPLFPRAYRWAMTGCKSISRIGRSFIRLLIRVGLRKPGDGKRGQIREGREKYAPLSFHCLRHNFTTMLKMRNVPEAIARKIGGHRSVAVSDIYTHLGEDVMLSAVQNVPQIIDVARRHAMQHTPGTTPAGTVSNTPPPEDSHDSAGISFAE